MTRPAPFTGTYRLQLHAGFTLADARELVPYLEALGVSHAYTSPVLAARPGSQHCYDVIDPSRLNPELGDRETLCSFADALHGRTMGWLLDIVPNHMAVSPLNRYWDDVLLLGSNSPYARWFDIAWNAPQNLHGRVMLPVLGDELDAVIERNELRVAYEDGRFRLRYFDHSFPVDPSTLPELFEPVGGDAHAQDPARIVEQFSSGDAARARLRTLVDAQPYALSFWRRAATHINYRRFFEINDLVAVRQEDSEVFDATHALILEWVEHGLLDGVRVDHVDGLFDPAAYLRRLRESLDVRAAARGAHPPIYVEKILEHDERLRDDWPVAGTTGYEVLNDLEAVLIDSHGSKLIEDTYRELLGLGERGPYFRDVARYAKQYMLRHSFDADIRRVARTMVPVLRRRDPHALASQRALRSVMMQLTAAFPVYRSYLTGGAAAPEDRALIERAEAAARKVGIVDAALLARVTDVLLREDPSDAGDIKELRRKAIALFQQITSPAMAKGIEDTALYMYAPLASLNEVGGTPDRDLSHALRRLHQGAAERRARWPKSLVCTFTHDTKRSADLRARLDVLSEIP
ncbi:MAG TPA: malto-oligosyltrehalose synthase, partial [Gemmatimonadaceae bacterium]|nr:malto-oligosyltrehalose synthase [Gemmatimonadaceae bacterium]